MPKKQKRKQKNKKSRRKGRPPRLYFDEKGRYIILNRKKIYIDSPMTNEELLRFLIMYFETKKKGKKRRKKTKKGVAKEMTGPLSGSSTGEETDKSKKTSGASDFMNLLRLMTYQNAAQRGRIEGQRDEGPGQVQGLIEYPRQPRSGDFPSSSTGELTTVNIGELIDLSTKIYLMHSDNRAIFYSAE